MTKERYEAIRDRLAEGGSIREIARVLGCTRCAVRRVRDGTYILDSGSRVGGYPSWTLQIDWMRVLDDLRFGRTIKSVWAERAPSLTSYSAFWKILHRKQSQDLRTIVPTRRPPGSASPARPAAADARMTLDELFAKVGLKRARSV